MAIGLGTRQGLGGDRATGAGFVFEHHVLAQAFLQLHGQGAAQQIRAAARGVGNQQLDGAVRPRGRRCGLGPGRACGAQQNARERENPTTQKCR